ncbi:hypothetical protein FO519_004482 [Halicephalobus sp. NKZ332]|nr:hypothetical protein FO519_004482 [Halicephalobus sp. NKZ332]
METNAKSMSNAEQELNPIKEEKRNDASANPDQKQTSPHPGRRVGTRSETAPNGMKKIVIGVCAMERKANSKPMKAIMCKILEYYNDWLSFVIFPEDVIMNEPVEKWPLCDCLISFHATDFPLNKAIEYERLRRPYVINDLHRQYDLLDRRKVFRALARAGIGHPRHCVLVRDKDGNVEGGEVNETADSLEVNGMVFSKPFVEKPISAEDHNVYIYYPSSINDRSSWYSPVSHVRKEGSYIYEEFIPADGTDVKVYAVGPFYAHAEARKAPGLDGKVDRDSDGKEVRYPVILSAKEKMIARRVVCAFGQTVCGFDLLRANGMSYVCDVNGFSFVKTSTKYYEDTAKILGNTILRRLASCLSIPWHIPIQDELSDDPPLVSTVSGRMMELRCVIAVIRHGDRTPKQKMKLVVDDERFFALFHKYDGKEKREIKMKRPNQLMEVLELCREMLQETVKRRGDKLEELCELKLKSEDAQRVQIELDLIEQEVKKWDQMRTVLEMYGHFSGINRKVQLKYLKPKPDHEEDIRKKPALLLIIKWGGELTTAGILQAEALGKLFRTLYPGIRRTDGKECPEDTQGLGFLRLHSTYRHDLKIYSSDEGRVQMTAAAFAKGLLALEGELTPILMQMVKSSNTDGLLNDDFNARQFQSDLKSFLHSALQVDRDFSQEDYLALNPSGLKSISNAMDFIKNPYKMCHEITGYVQKMVEIIRWHKENNPNKTLYLNETWELAESRWAKELREFRVSKRDNNGAPYIDFDISKIPDIYDNIKYDLEHNPELGINNEGEFERMYLCVKNMADIVEYGISEESKILIAQRVCTPLLGKLRNDLHRCVQSGDEGDENQTRLDPRASEGIATPMRHVRTRLYFTSESHIHTLMNLIRYSGLCSPDDKKWQRAMNFLSSVTEFNYMTQVVLMVYEDSRSDSDKNSNPIERQGNPTIFVDQQKVSQSGLMKSMSDISCNRRARSCSIDQEEEERPISRGSRKLLSPDELDESQATVGSGKGKWAKALVAETKLAMGIPIGPDIMENKESEHRRPYACEVFSRGDVIVMKRSESNDGNPLTVIPAAASTATIASEMLDESSSANSKRSRFPYKFKHHTVNLLTGKSGVENRLISTDVLMGKFMDKEKKKSVNNPAVLSTAVIARSSSAPRLQTFTAEDQISVNEIRRFWPPLRSLETMHDNIPYKQFDEFFGKILSRSTPLPSPPKTPVQLTSQELQLSLNARMKNTIARLKAMNN